MSMTPLLKAFTKHPKVAADDLGFGAFLLQIFHKAHKKSSFSLGLQFANPRPTHHTRIIIFLGVHEMTSSNEKDSPTKMPLGAFSISLSVKDIYASKEFYEKLDFCPIGGNIEQKWLILQNDTTTIGLFQGMFDNNLLTFNPGWSHKVEELEEFQDIRDIQETLEQRGILPGTKIDPSTTGPASFTLVDPDGNTILMDQHVGRKK
jgi:lactoylglutathione lyase